VRRRGGSTATVADQAPRDVRSADVKWVTPRTYRLWRDIGLLGYDADSQPDPLRQLIEDLAAGAGEIGT
jgi:hypothetical protein